MPRQILSEERIHPGVRAAIAENHAATVRDVQSAVAACLAARREDRPANVAALRRLLRAPSSPATSPTLTPPDGIDAPAARPASRWGYGLLGASLLGLAMTLGVTRWAAPAESEATAAPVAGAMRVEAAATAPPRAPTPRFDAIGATVRLRDTEGDTWGPADTMRPGTYRIRADFGQGFVNAGRARIVAGQALHLACSSKRQACETRDDARRRPAGGP